MSRSYLSFYLKVWNHFCNLLVIFMTVPLIVNDQLFYLCGMLIFEYNFTPITKITSYFVYQCGIILWLV